ncbi:hypothetical protein HDU99_009961, partial [Rhizoclosmatium hyalinum]
LLPEPSKASVRTNSSSLVASSVDNLISALTQPETTQVSGEQQALLDQDTIDIHNTHIQTEMPAANFPVEEAVEAVSTTDCDTERANM